MLQLAQRTNGAQIDQGLDQHRGLNGHVQRAGDADALEGLGRTAYFLRMDIRPGISNSAIEISLRPQSARFMSANLNSESGCGSMWQCSCGLQKFSCYLQITIC